MSEILQTPEAEREFDYEFFKLKMKPVAKWRLLSFALRYPDFLPALLGASSKSPIDAVTLDGTNPKGYKDLIKLISEHITEWSLGKDITPKTIESLPVAAQMMIVSAFISMNFITEEDLAFFGLLPSQEDTSQN